jgi:hypothetical protein
MDGRVWRTGPRGGRSTVAEGLDWQARWLELLPRLTWPPSFPGHPPFFLAATLVRLAAGRLRLVPAMGHLFSMLHLAPLSDGWSAAPPGSS